MKSYIGTKTVKAEPCNFGTACDRLGYVPGGEMRNTQTPGYLVVYPDGYRSWSPKDVFETSYKVANTPYDRLRIEINDLYEKGERLKAFISSNEKFAELGINTQAMMYAQHAIMGEYYHLLCGRSAAMEFDADVKFCNLSFGVAIELLINGYAVRRKGWNGKNLMIFKQVPAQIPSEIIPRMQSLPQEAKRLILEHKGEINYESQCLIYNSETGRADSWVPSISDVFATDWELVTT